MTANPYDPPRAAVGTTYDGPSARKLTMKEMYLSSSGRVSRKPYWGYGLLMAVPLVILELLVFLTRSIGPIFWLLVAVTTVFGIAAIVMGINLQIKRWHDRDKSGWWCLIGLIPYIGGIWVLIECGCLRGTAGPNRFGPDATDLY